MSCTTSDRPLLLCHCPDSLPSPHSNFVCTCSTIRPLHKMVWHLLMLFISLANGLCSCEQDRRADMRTVHVWNNHREERDDKGPTATAKRERCSLVQSVIARLLSSTPSSPRGTVMSDTSSVPSLLRLPSHLFFFILF